MLVILLDVLGQLLLELVRDRLVVDERENVLLLVRRVYGVADDVCALEQMRVQLIQREGHIDNVLWRYDMLCGDTLALISVGNEITWNRIERDVRNLSIILL